MEAGTPQQEPPYTILVGEGEDEMVEWVQLHPHIKSKSSHSQLRHLVATMREGDVRLDSGLRACRRQPLTQVRFILRAGPCVQNALDGLRAGLRCCALRPQ